MNRIKELNISRFRHLSELPNIRIGEKLTVIAGGNGLGKSSLLGLIGHVFSWRQGGRARMNPFCQTPLETQFSEVFRFSPDHDYASPYSYSLVFADGTTREAVSRFVGANRRFRIDVGTREKGRGKVSCAVIYLGLKRLIPLAQEREESITKPEGGQLSETERALYREWHNRVLVLDDEVSPLHTKSRNKEVYFPVCEKYDELGSSAGQDNLAQIIMALLAFRRIRDEMGDRYLGGILLIDEVETTLYPAAQHELMRLLLRAAGDYDIQIIFTTHSTDIITYMLKPRDRTFFESTEIIYLHRPRGAVAVCQDKASLPDMLANLKHEVSSEAPGRRINVYLEDAEARVVFKKLAGPQLRSQLTVSNSNMGAGVYENLLKNKIPEFRRALIVIDGDQRRSSRLKRNPNVLFLPGAARPENVFYDFLCGLPEDDEFWDPGLGRYTKQAFLRGRPSNTVDRETMKQWFNREKVNWGRGCSKLMRRWIRDHQTEVDAFNVELGQKIEGLKCVP